MKGYTSVDEMLKKEELDGVNVCTPASTHLAVASKTLGAGVNTFVEKPMTSTLKEGEELMKVSEASGKILTVGFIERFNPAITELKKITKEGSLGKPILFEYRRENRRGENITDVGVVKDASVHDIDTARWLFGEEPRTVYARVGSVMGQERGLRDDPAWFQRTKDGLHHHQLGNPHEDKGTHGGVHGGRGYGRFHHPGDADP